MGRYHVVVMKSTVVPSTTDSVVLPILENYSRKKAGEHFGLAMNPEFLREGSALQDSLNPDRIVVGGLDQKSIDTVMKLYSSFDCPKMETDLRTAEMIKYCANCFLAAKITFSNEMANICELMGIDVYEVMKGVGTDFRINPNFLRAGCGFGGSCFPKDVNAITSYSESKGYSSQILNAILDVNEIQPLRVVELAEKALGNLHGKKIALLGLSFKADTDDVRFTRALPILEGLVEKGADIVAYDPKGIENFKILTDKPVTYVSSAKEALKDADLCVIQTEWQEFKELSPDDFKTLMRSPIIIDGRRTFDPTELIKNGVKYLGIGWKNNL
jgi:UDPglucose 6-dehydrogenase